MKQYTDAYIREKLDDMLTRYFGISFSEATQQQLYDALATLIRNELLKKRKDFNNAMKEQKAKRVYYLCMEFLVGRSLKNNLYNLGMTEAVRNILKERDFELEDLFEMEPDAGLGNGGLGRLAACFMDSLATLQYPATGFSICYEYGLFRQRLVDGWQTELPDVWLPGGEVWLMPRSDRKFSIKFDGRVEERWENGHLVSEHKDYTEVDAIAYDMMISGADSEIVSVLRLWRARNHNKFDMTSFSQGDYMRATREDNEAELISKVLYPSDDHYEGKSLRLKQQYFLVSASLQSILHDVMKLTQDIHELPDYAAIHINDTHPALVIPELMRILLDNYLLPWEEAWDIVTRTVAYTNHTVMAEALETWPQDLIQRKLPRIYNIIAEIDNRFRKNVWDKTGDPYNVEACAILFNNQVKMANLSVIGSHNVNGVSALHSEIIKDSVFNSFYRINPEKFSNVTNGIAHRRWLCQSNPELTALLSDCIGDGFVKNASELKKFEAFKKDEKVLKRLDEIKLHNKQNFSNYLAKTTGVQVDPMSRFDVQVKRLHEYKRQLMNALKIIYLYDELKANPDLDVTPQTFIFGAKAASGYYMAKEIIKLIYFIAQDIEKNPKIREKLKVVFLENYCVSLAERLMPASEISEQISTAGKEASGTGNMKFMINGALTLGTMDGANVEIFEAVGADNIFIFGNSAQEAEQLWKNGYDSMTYFLASEALQRTLASLQRGFAGVRFDNIYNYLIKGSGIADPYMCLADFTSYLAAHNRMDATYQDRKVWNQMSLVNIANAGIFAADRSIEDYAREIWNVKKISTKKH